MNQIQVFVKCDNSEDNQIYKKNPSTLEDKVYKFDRVFGKNETIQQIFESILPTMEECLQKQSNFTILLYGQEQKSEIIGFEKEQGLFSFYYSYLESNFNQKIQISAYVIQIDQIIDLFTQSDKPQDLKIRCTKDGQYFIDGLKEIDINNFQEIQAFFSNLYGSLNKHKQHMVIQLKVQNIIFSIVRLVDINKKLYKQQELSQISNHFTALNNVIQAISKNKQMIPYRDSKLTFALKNNLSPPSKIIIIGFIDTENQDSLHELNYLKALMNQKEVKINLPQSTEKQVPQSKQNLTHQEQSELISYLSTLLIKLNQYVNKQINNNIKLQELDLDQPLQQIVDQIQQISKQFINTINQLAQSAKLQFQQPSQQSQVQSTYQSIKSQFKQENLIKALQFIVNEYEEKVMKENYIIRDKLVQIINQGDSLSNEQIHRIFFQEQETKGLQQTLGTLRRYTSTITYPQQKFEKKTSLIQSVYQKEVQKDPQPDFEESQSQYQYFQENLQIMDKFTGNQSEIQD